MLQKCHFYTYKDSVKFKPISDVSVTFRTSLICHTSENILDIYIFICPLSLMHKKKLDRWMDGWKGVSKKKKVGREGRK
jgi:hypothetical protein